MCPNCACRVYIGAITTLTVFTHFLLGLIEFQFMPLNLKPFFLAKIHVNSKEFAVTADPLATDYRVDTHNLFDHDHLEGAWTFFRSDESVQPPHS